MFFSGQPLNWKPTEYLIPSQEYENEFCLYMKGADKDYVFGDDFMLNKYIIYQDTKITIYPDSNCNTMPQTALSSEQNPEGYSHDKRVYLIVIIIASVILVVFFIAIGYYKYKKYTTKKEEEEK